MNVSNKAAVGIFPHIVCTRPMRPFSQARVWHAREDFKKHILRAAAAEVAKDEKTDSAQLVQDTIEFLKTDLIHLFDEKGIDVSKYDDNVDFQDPITSYNSIRGYKFNIRLLKNFLSPTFDLLDIKQSGEYEITTRWTMTMKFNFIVGPLKSFWNPQLIFTGVSIYGINPKNGKINKHIDLWDSIDNQQYFSPEAFSVVLQQALSLTQTPNLETPEYKVLKKFRSYEIREYRPFLVAETGLDEKKTGYVNPASRDMGLLFNRLAEYIFGGNKGNEKMEMTTPVFTDTSGKMQFVIGSKYKDEADLPEPKTEVVTRKQTRGGLFAVSSFSGLALENQVTREHERLYKLIVRDKMVPGDEWILARYNDPFTNPILRRNEILIPIEDGFSLW